jgi:hypothetical protein
MSSCKRPKIGRIHIIEELLLLSIRRFPRTLLWLFTRQIETINFEGSARRDLYLFFFGFFAFLPGLAAGFALAGTLTTATTFVVGASVVAAVVVVVVVVVFTALPEIGKVCSAMIKTAAKRSNDDGCIFECKETTKRT